MITDTTEKKQEKRNGYTRLLGVIGWPIGPWPSMTLYNAAFQALGMSWFCMPLPVEREHLREAVLGLRALGFVGAEVSQPYQCEVLDLLDELSPAARAIGAVRYIELDEEDRLVGLDLRWSVFLDTLRRFSSVFGGLRPLVIGAGDMASSIVYALTRERLPLTIVDQRMGRAIELVHRLRHVTDQHSISIYRWPQDLEQVAPNANLIINTATIEDGSNAEGSPWPDGLPFPPNALVFDLTLGTCDTHFLRQARASGARTVSGLHILVYETAVVLERWTGHRPSTAILWRLARKTLSKQTLSALSLPEPSELQLVKPAPVPGSGYKAA